MNLEHIKGQNLLNNNKSLGPINISDQSRANVKTFVVTFANLRNIEEKC